MHLIICGGRDYKRFSEPEKAFLDDFAEAHDVTTVITGGARGVDTWAHQWAMARGYNCVVFYANWVRYGAFAGPERNRRMARYVVLSGDANAVLAFPGGRGTASMCAIAEEMGIAVYRYVSPREEGQQ